MQRGLLYSSCFLALVLLTSMSVSAEGNKSVGINAGYNFAHSGCEDDNLDCDDQSFTGGAYFRHNLYQEYFYQISFDYLGQYQAIYPALADQLKEAKYTGDIWGIGISAGYNFVFTDKQSMAIQLGVLPWYVDVEGHEIDETVSNDSYGVSPFASLSYQYNMTQSSYLELGYQYTYGVGSDSTGGADISQLFLGLGYRFGEM